MQPEKRPVKSETRLAFKRLFFEQILPSEGGYSAYNPATEDPETLFGITKDAWIIYLNRINRDEIIAMTGGENSGNDIQTHLLAVKDSGTPQARAEAVSSFMRYVNDTLLSKVDHSPRKDPPSEHYKAPPHAPDWQKHQVEQVHTLAFNVFFEDYVVRHRIDEFPGFIAPYLADFAMNAGSRRAFEAFTQTLEQSKASLNISITKVHGIAVLDDNLRNKLENLTPQQKQEFIQTYNKKRLEFYRELASDNPKKSVYRNGWEHRTQQFYRYVQQWWDDTLPEPSTPPREPIASTRIEAFFEPDQDKDDPELAGFIHVFVPGRTSFLTYKVDKDGNIINANLREPGTNKPQGVSLDTPADKDRNPFPSGYAFSWRTNDGRRHYINITPEENLRIMRAQNREILEKGFFRVRPTYDSLSNYPGKVKIDTYYVPGTETFELPPRLKPEEMPWPSTRGLRIDDGTRPENMQPALARKIAGLTGLPQRDVDDIIIDSTTDPMPMVVGASTFAKVQSKKIAGGYEIAVEIPNRGIIRYETNENFEFRQTVSASTRISIDLSRDEDRNPYGVAAYSWLDEAGERQYLPVSAKLSERIVLASQIPQNMPLLGLQYNTPANFTFLDQRTKTALDPAKSAYLAISSEEPFSHQTYMVLDNNTYHSSKLDYSGTDHGHSMPLAPQKDIPILPKKSSQSRQ